MDLYLQGLATLNQGQSAGNVATARALFARAVTADPDNVEARVGLAAADYLNGAYYFVPDAKAAFAAAEEGLNKALTSAPEHALAHMWLGFVYMFTKRGPQALADCESMRSSLIAIWPWRIPASVSRTSSWDASTKQRLTLMKRFD